MSVASLAWFRRGLVVQGGAKAGDFVAFYPGTVFTRADLEWSGGYSDLFSRSSSSRDYLLARVGGMIIDGLGSGCEVSRDESPDFYALLEERDKQGVVAPAEPGRDNGWYCF